MLRFVTAWARGLPVVGQLPAAGTARSLRTALPKDSRLTPCVDRALSTPAADGTLARLEARWPTIPVLR